MQQCRSEEELHPASSPLTLPPKPVLTEPGIGRRADKISAFSFDKYQVLNGTSGFSGYSSFTLRSKDGFSSVLLPAAPCSHSVECV